MVEFGSRYVAFRTLVWILPVLLIAPPRTALTNERLEVLRAVESITSSELQRHVDALADDAFEGRASGTRGGHAAAGYLVKLLQDAGVPGGGEDGGYYQNFSPASRNVLGWIEGRDPELRKQVVVVSAHYDHVGYGNQRNSLGPWGYVHNGADDNASGTAGVLEIVQALKQLGAPPRRSMLIAFWDGEEAGLLGSQHWIQHPTFPLAQAVAMLNVDMIGRLRDDRVEVYGARTTFGMRELLSRQNRDLTLKLDFLWDMKANSDHYTFYSHGIPAIMLHTGLHGEYHRPSDDAHLINSAGMQRVTRLLFQTAYHLAEADARTEFRSACRSEGPGQKDLLEAVAAPPAPRLGVTWQVLEAGGLKVTQVLRGSAAERAGIRTGDEIREFAGLKINGEESFRRKVVSATNPVTLVVKRTDEEEPRSLQVELAGAPARIGLMWREDDAEPGMVIVTQVVSGSAADFAGLQPRDRILEVAGQPFRGGEQLYQRLTTSPSPVNLLIETNGQIRELSLVRSAEDEPTSPVAD